MPGIDAPGRRGRLSVVLIWLAVGMAAVAALLLLVGTSELLLRSAAGFGLGAAVLIGAIVLVSRRSSMSADLEYLVSDQMQALHRDIRADIANAERKTQRSLADQLTTLQKTVDALHGQVESVRRELERASVSAVAAGSASRPATGSPPASRAEPVWRGEPVSRREPAAEPAEPAPPEESWTEQLLRRRFGSRLGKLEPNGFGGADPAAAENRAWTQRHEPWRDEPRSDEPRNEPPRHARRWRDRENTDEPWQYDPWRDDSSDWSASGWDERRDGSPT